MAGIGVNTVTSPEPVLRDQPAQRAMQSAFCPIVPLAHAFTSTRNSTSCTTTTPTRTPTAAITAPSTTTPVTTRRPRAATSPLVLSAVAAPQTRASPHRPTLWSFYFHTTAARHVSPPRPHPAMPKAASSAQSAAASPPPPTTSPSHPSAPPPPPPEDNNRSPDFHANVGTVIDTLRADYPHILTHSPDLAIFRDDMILSDASGNRLVGKDAYRTVLFLLRAHSKLFLTAAQVHIVSLTYHDETAPAVHIRWRMRATPRTWATARRNIPAIIDGLCVYHLDASGNVHHHAFETRVYTPPRQVESRSAFAYMAGVRHIVSGPGCAPYILRAQFDAGAAAGAAVADGSTVSAAAAAAWIRTLFETAALVSVPLAWQVVLPLALTRGMEDQLAMLQADSWYANEPEEHDEQLVTRLDSAKLSGSGA